MKRHALFFALLCCSTIIFAATSFALTIPASEDSYTAPRNTLSYSTNNASALFVDATRKSYLYFDLSDIPQDAVVRWAKLRLFLPTVRTPGAGLSVHLVTGTWNESTRLADVPSIVAGSLGMIAPDKMASRRFVTVDVKDTVQKWINGGTLNEGFAIQPIVKAGSPTASVMLTSKEGPVFGLPAELDIEFNPDHVDFEQLPSDVQSLLGVVARSDEYRLRIEAQYVSADGADISVKATGIGALKYQWMLNGVAIAGGTNAQLPTQGLQSGTYTVVVSNTFGNLTSGSVQFSAGFASLPPDFALVFGGTLPASSPLGAVSVDTFYIGKTEVTWGEWQTVRAWAVVNGYTDLADVGSGGGSDYPVGLVSWPNVVKWCNARSEKEGKTPVYKSGADIYRTGTVSEPQVDALANGYRLPSEKEWEFAARGGTETKGYTYSGSNNLDAVGWYWGNAPGTEPEVRKKLPNELGIFDMSGNYSEWTGSWHPSHVGLYRVVRGGGRGSTAGGCTPAYRTYNGGQNSASGDLGFRLALSAIP